MIKIITLEMVFSDGLFAPVQYPAYVIDDFLSQEECNLLISDSTNFLTSITNVSKIHGGRVMLPWTSLEFNSLLNLSSSRETLENHRHSRDNGPVIAGQD